MVFQVFSLIFGLKLTELVFQTTIDADGKIMTFFTQLCSCGNAKNNASTNPKFLYFSIIQNQV